MRKLASFLRLLPLAAAAFASVATSAPPSPYLRVLRVTPPAQETGVSPDVALQVATTMEDGTIDDCPAGLGLRTLSGTPIAGTSHRVEVSGEIDYRFTPDAPLAPDSYVLFWVGSTGADWSFDDYEQSNLAAAYDGDTWPREVVTEFSTVSQPQLRLAYVDINTGTVYISFSEDMDASTLEHVKVLDATGDVLPAEALWTGGDMHRLELHPPVGAVSLLLEPGLLAASGVDAAPTPLTVELERR
jgi:hypothetical protein